MNKKVVFSTLIALILLLSIFSPPVPAKAAVSCSCVNYIKSYFGVTEPIGNAYQVGTWLLNHGFVRVSGPQLGAVAVMQPGFPGADKTYGHVGIITGISQTSTDWRITIKGANQLTGSTLFTEFDCYNVRNTSWPSYAKSNTKIAYYKAYNYAIRSSVTRSGYSSLYFDVTGGSTSAGAQIIGWHYHGGNNQLFNLIRYGSEYKIISRISAMCVVPQTTGQGARLVQKKCAGASGEKWQLISTSTGYILRNYQTGLVADLNNGSLSPGTTILAWGSHNGINQRWRFEIK